MISRNQNMGFTLIELLVSIAIIGVMAALLLSALSRAKNQTKEITCLNNLKQWGLATRYFTDEHDDFLPDNGSVAPINNYVGTGWYMQLPPEIGLPLYTAMPWRTNKSPLVDLGHSIWICPANKRYSTNGAYLFHYSLNELWNGVGDSNHPIKMSAIRIPPSVAVWLVDSRTDPPVGSNTAVHTNLHASGANLLFLDGHAAWVKSTEYYDFKLKKYFTNNPSMVWKQW